jgi:hypothetical protein
MLQHEALELASEQLRLGADGAGWKGDDGICVASFAGTADEDGRESRDPYLEPGESEAGNSPMGGAAVTRTHQTGPAPRRHAGHFSNPICRHPKFGQP